jgi:hypothetical protein
VEQRLKRRLERRLKQRRWKEVEKEITFFFSPFVFRFLTGRLVGLGRTVVSRRFSVHQPSFQWFPVPWFSVVGRRKACDGARTLQ